jgi:hypothetical protein
MLKGLREFILKFKDGPDFPLIEDLVEALRPHAADPKAFDAFVNQWLLGKVLPEFSLREVRHEADGAGRHTTTGLITNTGTGTVEVEVAAMPPAETNDPDSMGEEGEKPRAPGSLQTVTVGPGQTVPWKLTTEFKPAEVVVDPDVKVLQMARKLAKAPVP